jgi:hypothetical protein
MISMRNIVQAQVVTTKVWTIPTHRMADPDHQMRMSHRQSVDD